MEMFSLYQLLVPTFAVLMILRALSNLGRGGKTTREFVAVTIVWTGLSLVALFPTIFIDKVAVFLGIRSGINVLFFSGIVLLFYMAFRLFVSQEEMQEKLTETIRQIAIKEFKDELSMQNQGKPRNLDEYQEKPQNLPISNEATHI